MLPLTRTRTLLVSSPETLHPTTPHTQPLPGITRTWFSLIHVRSPLLAESQVFSSPTGTEMFHFPASTSTQTMHSSAGNTTQPVLGSPIRTSSDQRFVDNSPRHNAASHVLHRLSMPRHPPYALNNQTIIQHTQTHTTTQRAAHAQIHKTQKQSCKLTKQKILHNTTPQAHTNMRTRMRQRRKMLASTIQFSHNTPTPQQPHTTNSAVIIHVQANKTTTTTHNTTLRAGHVLPQTPNSMPTYPKPCLRNTGHTPAPHKAEASNPAGAHPPGILNKTVAVTPTATSTTNPQPWAQQ